MKRPVFVSHQSRYAASPSTDLRYVITWFSGLQHYLKCVGQLRNSCMIIRTHYLLTLFYTALSSSG